MEATRNYEVEVTFEGNEVGVFINKTKIWLTLIAKIMSNYVLPRNDGSCFSHGKTNTS